jgi:hypothetical protein
MRLGQRFESARRLFRFGVDKPNTGDEEGAGLLSEASLHHRYITGVRTMVESSERLKSLRDGFAELQFGDDNGLHRLSTRAEMLIKRVFGESSGYLGAFNAISFWSGSHGAEESYERSAYEKGKDETVHLVDTMLEDLELSQSEVATVF